MKVKDLFILHQGNSLELMNLETVELSNINFVARTAQNNGVVAQVEELEDIEPFPAGCISVALGGSVLSSFVQAKPFYTAFHIMALEPKTNMSLQEKLFYCMCIKANAYRYGYGRQANKTLKDIELPSTLPKWVKVAPIEPIKTSIKKRPGILRPIQQWKNIRVGDIFSFENCKCSDARSLLSDGDDCYYLGAKKHDNGVMRRVAYDEELMTAGNCIVFICDGQGSVGYSNYMNEDFIGSTTLTVGRNEYINKYVGMFLVSVLDLERPKYSFGRKYRTNLADTVIKLPATAKGLPDWDYMEKYIKSLPYSDRI